MLYMYSIATVHYIVIVATGSQTVLSGYLGSEIGDSLIRSRLAKLKTLGSHTKLKINKNATIGYD